ncbi:MAG: hypothetical protein IJ935_13200 [Afipia sp.]|nr:hypothetical protein [Afipia sp.]
MLSPRGIGSKIFVVTAGCPTIVTPQIGDASSKGEAISASGALNRLRRSSGGMGAFTARIAALLFRAFVDSK